MMRRLPIATLAVAAFLLPACSRTPTSPSAPPVSSPPVSQPPVAMAPAQIYAETTVSFTSDPQDSVGRGDSMTFTLANANFEAAVYRSGGWIQVFIRGRDSALNNWGFNIVSPVNTRITPGTYDTVRLFNDPVWGADFYGRAQGCNRASGRLVIHAVEFSPDFSALRLLRASLENHCEQQSPALRAEIALLADPWR